MIAHVLILKKETRMFLEQGNEYTDPNHPREQRGDSNISLVTIGLENP